METTKSGSLPVLLARGLLSAAATWKALLLALLVNASLSLVLAIPLSASLHSLFDRNPAAAGASGSGLVSLLSHAIRLHPEIGTGTRPSPPTGVSEKGPEPPLPLGGAAGTALLLGVVHALASSVLFGGLAGRFASERERGSLGAFGQDCGRFVFSSLALGVVSLSAAGAAWFVFWDLPGTLYEPLDLRYEWEAVLLSLARAGLFLTAVFLAHAIVVYARATVGAARNGDPFFALATATRFVFRHPFRVLFLEGAYAATSFAVILLWARFAPPWEGGSTGTLVLLVLLQQLVLLLRITLRAGSLGTAVTFLKLGREG